jgi:cysteine-S-conjugate beta-lyase
VWSCRYERCRVSQCNLLLIQELYFVVNATGVGLGPFECFLLMRGIKTLAVRMEKQQVSAMKIATFLEEQGFKVRYPGLKSHPQHDLHFKMARGAGAVLSFETGDIARSERIVEATRLWLISVSFGCVNSLIRLIALNLVCLVECLMHRFLHMYVKSGDSLKI